MLCQDPSPRSLAVTVLSWICFYARASLQTNQIDTKVDKIDPTTFEFSRSVKQPRYLMQKNEAIYMTSIDDDVQPKTILSLALEFHIKKNDLEGIVSNSMHENPSILQKSYPSKKTLSDNVQKTINSKSKIGEDISLSHIKSYCGNNLMCNICLRIFSKRTCKEKYFRSWTIKDKYVVDKFKQRKLLQSRKLNVGGTKTEADPEVEEQNLVTDDFNHTPTDESTESSASKKRMEELSQLIEELGQDISKEPIWAMISVTFLMLFFIFVGKLCGMRVIKPGRDVHVDIDEDFHNVSVLEVVRVKKRFLPQGLFRLKSRLYRKFRKKRRKIKEKDISEPLTDDSEEERLIYDRLSPV